MKYMLLIYGAEDAAPAPTSPEGQAEFARWGEVTQEMAQAGVLTSGEALQPVSTATTVAAPGGETVLTDGPFAETREVLGGYYVIEVSDLDAATSWAAKLPNVGYGRVEVRPIMEVPTG